MIVSGGQWCAWRHESRVGSHDEAAGGARGVRPSARHRPSSSCCSSSSALSSHSSASAPSISSLEVRSSAIALARRAVPRCRSAAVCLRQRRLVIIISTAAATDHFLHNGRPVCLSLSTSVLTAKFLRANGAFDGFDDHVLCRWWRPVEGWGGESLKNTLRSNRSSIARL